MKKKMIYALGFFDGVHLGHQALLETCVELAKKQNMRPGAITFEKHPQSLFTPTPPPLINTDADRDRLLQQWGMEYVRKLPVTKEVMSTDWLTFLHQLLQEGAGGFVCGADYRFGRGGEGDAQKLAQFCNEKGLPCVVVSDQLLDGIRVSSTHIRSLLEAGEMAQAVRFLGHPHMLSGTVIAGRGLGHTIGIPTANLELPRSLVCPRLGVYACTAEVEGNSYPAVTNIGSRPTVGGHHITVEPWLLDFSGDLYGKPLILHFHKFLRPEEKFETLEALRTQIQRDAAETYKYIRR